MLQSEQVIKCFCQREYNGELSNVFSLSVVSIFWIWNNSWRTQALVTQILQSYMAVEINPGAGQHNCLPGEQIYYTEKTLLKNYYITTSTYVVSHHFIIYFHLKKKNKIKSIQHHLIR